MLMPRVYVRDMFDDLFDDSFRHSFGDFHPCQMMRTDVIDAGDGYEVTIDMPGVKKEDVRAELRDGSLTIRAESGYSNDECDDQGNYIRRERCTGSYSRSFYVGDAVRQEDIRAKFENGTLKLLVPKKDPQITGEEKTYIPIEG